MTMAPASAAAPVPGSVRPIARPMARCQRRADAGSARDGGGRRRSRFRAVMSKTSVAKFSIGQVIRHRLYAFRGVVFDVDPQFADRAPSYETIDLIERRQRKDQPFYYLFAENEQTPYI